MKEVLVSMGPKHLILLCVIVFKCVYYTGGLFSIYLVNCKDPPSFIFPIFINFVLTQWVPQQIVDIPDFIYYNILADNLAFPGYLFIPIFF